MASAFGKAVEVGEMFRKGEERQELSAIHRCLTDDWYVPDLSRPSLLKV